MNRERKNYTVQKKKNMKKTTACRLVFFLCCDVWIWNGEPESRAVCGEERSRGPACVEDVAFNFCSILPEQRDTQLKKFFFFIWIKPYYPGRCTDGTELNLTHTYTHIFFLYIFLGKTIYYCLYFNESALKLSYLPVPVLLKEYSDKLFKLWIIWSIVDIWFVNWGSVEVQ